MPPRVGDVAWRTGCAEITIGLCWYCCCCYGYYCCCQYCWCIYVCRYCCCCGHCCCGCCCRYCSCCYSGGCSAVVFAQIFLNGTSPALVITDRSLSLHHHVVNHASLKHVKQSRKMKTWLGDLCCQPWKWKRKVVGLMGETSGSSSSTSGSDTL